MFRNSALFFAISLILTLSPAAVHAADRKDLHLIPVPQVVEEGTELSLAQGLRIEVSTDADDQFAAEDLRKELRLREVSADAGTGALVRLLRSDSPQGTSALTERHIAIDPPMHEEGYVILCKQNTITVVADTAAGIFYGVQTLKQLIHNNRSAATITTASIRDWPAMRYRAQDDDISRGPVPTLEYVKSQIRRFAAYKINIYSPYFEHTLQFNVDSLPAPPGGSFTADEMKEIIQYARQYHIAVIPQQEAFGHLHHVLKYERYAGMAETPHGSVLAPGNPESLQLAKRWFAELDDIFPAPFIHIGADETDDLGLGQTKTRVSQEGLGPVYIDFLKQLHNAAATKNKRVMFWGDVAMRSPELVKTLPKDMIAVAWQYSVPSGPSPFDRWILPFTAAGIETWIAPSANRGNRVDPDDQNNLDTIQQFVATGQRLGATGMFNTVWDDGGEGLFEQDWFGVLFGAEASWHSGKSDIDRFRHSFGLRFHNDDSGLVDQAHGELMMAHATLAKAGLSAKNALFWEDPWSRLGQRDTVKILPVSHELRIHAEQAIVLIQAARKLKNIKNPDALDAMEIGARKMDFIGQKFQQAQEIVDEYHSMLAMQVDPSRKELIDDTSYLITGNNGQCQDLRDGYGLIGDLFQKAWLRESLPYWLNNISAHYLLSMQLWIDRGVAIREAADLFALGETLPPPETLGMPAQKTTALH